MQSTNWIGASGYRRLAWRGPVRKPARSSGGLCHPHRHVADRSQCRLFAFAATVLLLSGCGFHLRNKLMLPTDTAPVKVVSTAPYSELVKLLNRSLLASGAKLADEDSKGPSTQLQVLSERWGDLPIAIDSQGRAQEYSLRYAVIFIFRREDGSELVPQQVIELSRDYVSPPTDATGTTTEREILADELRREMSASIIRRIDSVVRGHGGVTIVDEIYLGLSFDERFGHSALALPDGLGEGVISVNSFSKYFNMTGWRLGWMVVPQDLVPVIERLAQNLFICPSTIAQHAALACFEPESIALYEARRAEFKARRDYFIPALRDLGFSIPVEPDGAFYVWADCSELCARLGLQSSWEFAFEVMNRAHVAITPGRDFGTAQTAQFVRFSTASSMQQLETAIQRLRAMLTSV